MSKKKILVVTQYFYPEQFRINDMCLDLQKRGYEVTVLTGYPNYPKGKIYKGYGIFKKNDRWNDIEIIRVPIVPRGSSSVQLSLNYLSFLFTGSIWSMFSRKKFDKVFIYEVSPMTQAIPGILYAKKHKIKSHIYVLDLWPENFISMSGIDNQFIVNQIKKMVKYIYNNVSTIFVSSPGFEDNILKLGEYSEKIVYWPQYAEDFYKPISKNGENLIIKFDEEKFNVTFAGNIGYAQGLSVLPKTMLSLINSGVNNVKFNLIGDGRFKEELSEKIRELKLEEHFSFYDPIEATEIPKVMSQTDVALISLSKDPVFSLTIPAKIQSTLAMGIPVIVAADGILESVIDESKAGVWGPSEDVKKLSENIIFMNKLSDEELRQYGNAAIKYSESKFSKQNLIDQLIHKMEE